MRHVLCCLALVIRWASTLVCFAFVGGFVFIFGCAALESIHRLGVAAWLLEVGKFLCFVISIFSVAAIAVWSHHFQCKRP